MEYSCNQDEMTTNAQVTRARRKFHSHFSTLHPNFIQFKIDFCSFQIIYYMNHLNVGGLVRHFLILIDWFHLATGANTDSIHSFIVITIVYRNQEITIQF